MGNAEQILVIILSSFLALFLLLGIILLVLVIKVVRSVKRITDKAEQVADKAEAFGEFLRYSQGPLAIARVLTTVSEALFKRGSKKAKKG